MVCVCLCMMKQKGEKLYRLLYTFKSQNCTRKCAIAYYGMTMNRIANASAAEEVSMLPYYDAVILLYVTVPDKRDHFRYLMIFQYKRF